MAEKSIWKIIKERIEKANKNHQQFDKTTAGKQLDFDVKVNLMLYTAVFIVSFILIFVSIPPSYFSLLLGSSVFVERFILLAGLIVAVAMFTGTAYVISIFRYLNAYSKWKTKRKL